MNTAYTLIVRHCHNQLVARGWPASMEISANLSYRQGDGVAFYGRLDTHALLALLSALAATVLSQEKYRFRFRRTAP